MKARVRKRKLNKMFQPHGLKRTGIKVVGDRKKENDWKRWNRLHREGTHFSAVGEAKFKWGTKVLSEANTKRG